MTQDLKFPTITVNENKARKSNATNLNSLFSKLKAAAFFIFIAFSKKPRIVRGCLRKPLRPLAWAVCRRFIIPAVFTALFSAGQNRVFLCHRTWTLILRLKIGHFAASVLQHCHQLLLLTEQVSDGFAFLRLFREGVLQLFRFYKNHTHSRKCDLLVILMDLIPGYSTFGESRSCYINRKTYNSEGYIIQ